MTYLFDLTLHQGVIPNEWKCAIIAPIYKKGSCDKHINYRPASITSVMFRISESIVAEKIMDHLFSNNLLSDSQFGYLPRRSTCTQLLAALNQWYNSYESGISIYIVYCK